MNYFRKMIYLQDEGQERGGYIKASGKKEWFRLGIHVTNVKKWKDKTAFLVIEGADGKYNQIVGRLSDEEVTWLEGKVKEKEDIIGIWIGDVEGIRMGEGQPPVSEYIMAEEEKHNTEKAPEEEESPEYIEVEMEEEHNWKYECDKIFSTHMAMYPFPDDEVEKCVQIGPQDFGELPQKYWTLSGNPFLQQGFYHYRHLIFANIGNSIYIGVPGRYHKRDAYLGRVFGFSHFKSVHKSKLRMGDFGYWMMEVHPQSVMKDRECTPDIKERWNRSESNIPPEEDRQASVDRP
ncbi:MAG: DUF6128 domain-containing protein [Eubacterium sp.]